MRYVLIVFLLSFISETRTLFIGDSLSAFNGGWQDQLCVDKNWSKTNLAQTGKRTDWMLCQLTDHLISDRRYDQVIIYGGINDAYTLTNMDSTIHTVQKMVNLANAYKIKPIVIVGYKVNDVLVKTKNATLTFKKTKQQLAYETYQSRLEKEIVNATIIPAVVLERKFLYDGIHFNIAGHKEFYNLIKDRL